MTIGKSARQCSFTDTDVDDDSEWEMLTVEALAHMVQQNEVS